MIPGRDGLVWKRLSLAITAAWAAAACTHEQSAPAASPSPTPPEALVATEIPSPAGPGAAQPFVTAVPGDRVALSWIEKGSGTHRLRMAAGSDDGSWSAPQTIVESADLFVNWADFPSLVSGPDGTLVAHWLAKTAGNPYAYHVWLARSGDAGRTWSRPVLAHGDTSATEHGFVSLVPGGAGAVGVLWLDGRKMSGHGDHDPASEMTLRFATLDSAGRVSGERLVDDRVCDCCQTAMALTSKGLIAAYRDRSDREIRDVSYVVERGGRWSEPRAVASDGWEIHGCPVNGPQLDAAGDRVALAWFTMAHDTPRVNVAFSQDGGDTFGPPIGVDDGSPVGRVDVALVSSGAALVTWIETKGSAAALRARLIQPSGDRSPAIVIADSSGARSSGVPRLARVGGGAVVVWTDPGDPPRVRVARLKPRDS